MVRYSSQTTAIRLQKMCSVLYYNSLSTDRQTIDIYMWRIVLVRCSSWPLVSTTSGKRVRTSLHLLATKTIMDANDKFFHFTLCILPVRSADPCSAQGAAGRLATFWACSSCCKILWGAARLEELSVCWLWASVAIRRALHGGYDGTASWLPAPCWPLEMFAIFFIL